MILINLIGLVLIGLIIWWFWLYKPNASQVSNQQTLVGESKITVHVGDGIYQPARILLPSNKAVEIEFIRKDASPCAATVLFPDFDISAELPLNESIKVSLPAMAKGEYEFHCQMRMYLGHLIVE